MGSRQPRWSTPEETLVVAKYLDTRCVCMWCVCVCGVCVCGVCVCVWFVCMVCGVCGVCVWGV